MTTTLIEPEVRARAPIETWFGVGGGAELFANVGSEEALARCLQLDADLRVLGDGANLLVDDDGVDCLVVKLGGAFESVEIDPDGCVEAGAGVKLFDLIHACARSGLAGMERLGGIPASVGGAAVMNAGGAFGEMKDVVSRVRVMERSGASRWMDASDVRFGYRRSELGDGIVTRVEFRLERDDPAAIRAQLKDVMAFKKRSQPLADHSAGCVFKNPTLAAAVEGVGTAGDRVSAGLVIDRAGCKGRRQGCARVSEVHGNFIVAERGGRAADVISLMDAVRGIVEARFGVSLEPEVRIWRRNG